jgi:hypothetical protein
MFLFIGAPSLEISNGTIDRVELYSAHLGTDFMHVSYFRAGLRRIRQRMKGKAEVKLLP